MASAVRGFAYPKQEINIDIYYLLMYANIDKHDQRYIHNQDMNSFHGTTLTKRQMPSTVLSFA